MILKKIILHNIRSYEREEIEFPLGSTVLAGDIGAGKTSVLLAIEFALFGLQPGQRGSSLLRNDKNEGKVVLEMEVDGQEIILERGLKRGKSISQSQAKIEVDGEKSEMSVTELKNKVLELINYPKEFAKKTNLLYRFTVYTPQEEMKQIILENAEARLNTLRHIFGIDKYKRIRENTEIFTAKLREKIREKEVQIRNIDELKNKIRERKSKIDKIEEDILKIQKELEEQRAQRKAAEEKLKQIEEKIEEKKKYEREVEKTKIMLAGKKEIISNIEKEKKLLQEQIEEIKKTPFSAEKLKETEEQARKKEEEIEVKNKSYVELISKINSLNSKISEIEKIKEQIYSLDLCPTCLQNISEEYKQSITKKFYENRQKLEQEINNLTNQKEKLIKEIETIKEELNNLKKQLNKLALLKVKLETIGEKQEKLAELNEQEVSTKKDISLLEKQILTLKESISSMKKYDSIYEENEKQLTNLMGKEKEKEIELASIQKEKEMMFTNIKEIENELQEKEKIRKKLLEISEIEDWLGSSFLSVISFTERNIMLKLREEFSKLFNEWFNILVPEIFSVRLDEDFTPIIEQQDFQLDYSYLSGGERTAVALAYRLALNQTINSLLSKIKTRDLVMLDEPTDGFSEKQLDKMRDVLDELNVKQLIIVSHEPKIESFVENIIRFKKEDGVTKVVG